MTQEKEIPLFYVFEEIETNSYLTKMIQNSIPDKSGGLAGASPVDQMVTKLREEMEGLLVTVAEASINETEGGPRIFISGGKHHISLRKGCVAGIASTSIIPTSAHPSLSRNYTREAEQLPV